jgi:type II secretory pathway component PulM
MTLEIKLRYVIEYFIHAGLHLVDMTPRTKQILIGACAVCLLALLFWFHSNALYYGFTTNSIMCSMCH